MQAQTVAPIPELDASAEVEPLKEKEEQKESANNSSWGLYGMATVALALAVAGGAIVYKNIKKSDWVNELFEF